MIEQGTQEWITLRKSKIGASDAPIIMGVSPWRTSYQLWQEKLGMGGQKENRAMRYGKEMEEVARQAYQRMEQIEVQPQIVFHPDIDFMMASLDGLSSDGKRAVEIKNANADDHRLAKKGTIPIKYYPQMQHQLACLGIDELDYFSYHNQEGALVKVRRDDDYIEKLYAEEEKFWNCVLEFSPPENNHPKHKSLDNPEFVRLANEFANVITQLKTLEELEKSYRERLIAMANGHDVHGGGITIKKCMRKGAVDYKKIPELVGVDLDIYRKPDIESWIVKCEVD